MICVPVKEYQFNFGRHFHLQSIIMKSHLVYATVFGICLKRNVANERMNEIKNQIQNQTIGRKENASEKKKKTKQCRNENSSVELLLLKLARRYVK